MKTQQGLASLEKKVDRLLKVRIRLLMIKDKSQEVRELVARIDAQLDSIRKKVLKVSREGGAGGTGIRHSLVQNGGKSDQNVSSVLEAKIKLIERLISHNVTDSEVRHRHRLRSSKASTKYSPTRPNMKSLAKNRTSKDSFLTRRRANSSGTGSCECTRTMW